MRVPAQEVLAGMSHCSMRASHNANQHEATATARLRLMRRQAARRDCDPALWATGRLNGGTSSPDKSKFRRRLARPVVLSRFGLQRVWCDANSTFRACVVMVRSFERGWGVRLSLAWRWADECPHTPNGSSLRSPEAGFRCSQPTALHNMFDAP